jgi:hypothetical protein
MYNRIMGFHSSTPNDESRPIRYIGPGSGNGPPQCKGSQLKAITLNSVGNTLYTVQ